MVTNNFISEDLPESGVESTSLGDSRRPTYDELTQLLAISRDYEQNVTNAYAELLRDMTIERELRTQTQIKCDDLAQLLKSARAELPIKP